MLAYYTILALLFYAVATLDPDHRDEEEVIKAYVANKCSKNGAEVALENMKNSVEQTRKCVSNAFFTSRNNDFEYVCGEFRSILYSCLLTLTDSIEPCLDNEEKYIPDFMITFYNSSFDKHCKDGVEKLEDHVAVLNRVNCSRQETENYIFQRCLPKTTILKDFQDLDFVIPKNAFCGYLEHANQCAIDYVKEHCDVEFAKLIEYHLQPTNNWCENYVEKQAAIIASPERHN